MSEPIQSISQGNYILQGTVATSAGIVGDGSTQNPLRADETVLWEDWTQNNQTAGTIYNLSESYKNFERIGLTYDNMEYTGRIGYTEYPTVSSVTFRTPMINFNNGLSINIPFAFFAPSGDNIMLKSRGLLYNTWTDPQYTSGDWRGYRLHKVIGINRINNA